MANNGVYPDTMSRAMSKPTNDLGEGTQQDQVQEVESVDTGMAQDHGHIPTTEKAASTGQSRSWDYERIYFLNRLQRMIQ
ncbi:Hypothetical predicted protein [Marmota monax]|uniref:Uncharacterized protein n=1 Tax=Marmota monax TaxID=9995 RepID=A0A5E4AF82_MARMO|nr:hypothetical protein GHT09_017397 [Marmota monax]VTJ55162.1 Hypothetical predicted protein [Marmota monax]